MEEERALRQASQLRGLDRRQYSTTSQLPRFDESAYPSRQYNALEFVVYDVTNGLELTRANRRVYHALWHNAIRRRPVEW